MQQRKVHSAGADQPTARELDVLQLICEGCTIKEVAGRLGMSFSTAAIHRSNLFKKAGVDNSIKLFRWALKNGHVPF